MKLVFFGVLSMSIFKNNKCLEDNLLKSCLPCSFILKLLELSGNMLLLSVPYNVGFLYLIGGAFKIFKCLQVVKPMDIKPPPALWHEDNGPRRYQNRER